jgi:phospholipid/cholesterol/gamma-HCH transport system substrate-binding protein
MGRLGRFLRKSFLERNQIAIGVIGITVIAVASALALLLSGGVFEKTYAVEAVFKDAAGLRAGDEVTVAGLEAGRIGGVSIENGMVVMDLDIRDEVVMPVDSRAEIVVETLLGRKSVDLVAGDSPEPLADGDVIPVERTITPIEITELNDISVRLMEESDAQALEDLMAQVTNITKGKEREIKAVIDGLADVTTVLSDKKEQLKGVLSSLDTLSHTFAEEDDTIVSLIDRYNDVLGNLARRRGDLEALLVNTDSASHEVAFLVDRNRPVLDRTLDSLHASLRVVDEHQLDLAGTIAYLEESVQGYASVGYSQGVPNRWFNIFVQSLGPLGVDSLVGPCGLVDQALDEFLGPDPRDCEERRNFGDANEEGRPRARRDGPARDAERRDALRDQDAPGVPLPGDIDDLVDAVTGGALSGGNR